VVTESEVELALTTPIPTPGSSSGMRQPFQSYPVQSLRRAAEMAGYWCAFGREERSVLYVATLIRGIGHLLADYVVGSAKLDDILFTLVRPALHRLDDSAPRQACLLCLFAGARCLLRAPPAGISRAGLARSAPESADAAPRQAVLNGRQATEPANRQADKDTFMKSLNDILDDNGDAPVQVDHWTGDYGSDAREAYRARLACWILRIYSGAGGMPPFFEAGSPKQVAIARITGVSELADPAAAAADVSRAILH
jgi:hypothetical protein